MAAHYGFRVGHWSGVDLQAKCPAKRLFEDKCGLVVVETFRSNCLSSEGKYRIDGPCECVIVSGIDMYRSPNRVAVVRFFAEEDAATAVEYAVMIALIVGVCAASVTFLAARTKDSFDTSGAAIAGAFGN